MQTALITITRTLSFTCPKCETVSTVVGGENVNNFVNNCCGCPFICNKSQSLIILSVKTPEAPDEA